MAPALIRITPPTEVDAESVKVLAADLEAIAAGSVVVLDCSDVTFMDSSGIRTIVAESERHDANGGTLKVANPSAVVRRLLELTDLTRFISDEPV